MKVPRMCLWQEQKFQAYKTQGFLEAENFLSTQTMQARNQKEVCAADDSWRR